jgi:hypothetical protein
MKALLTFIDVCTHGQSIRMALNQLICNVIELTAAIDSIIAQSITDSTAAHI